MSRLRLRRITLCSGLIAEERLRQRAVKGEMDGIAAAVEIHNRLCIRSIILAEQCDRTVRARAAEDLPVAILDKTSPMSVIADALRIASPRTIHWHWSLSFPDRQVACAPG